MWNLKSYRETYCVSVSVSHAIILRTDKNLPKWNTQNIRLIFFSILFYFINDTRNIILQMCKLWNNLDFKNSRN